MGTGQLLYSIAPHFSFSKGIDISAKMLETAQKLLDTDFINLKGKI
jgi:ubiquinone/menaquinone biosynthesis C-methylase UbiE